MDSSLHNLVGSDIDFLMKNMAMDLMALFIHKAGDAHLSPSISLGSSLNITVRRKVGKGSRNLCGKPFVESLTIALDDAI